MTAKVRNLLALMIARTAAALMKGEWRHAYPREAGAAVLDERRHAKYWPPVGRVDNVYGDRNLFCACVPMSAYE